MRRVEDFSEEMGLLHQPPKLKLGVPLAKPPFPETASAAELG